jgi:hypothetical protein
MAKVKSTGGNKITFRKKVFKGKAKKKFGPNEEKPKKYRGQGR